MRRRLILVLVLAAALFPRSTDAAFPYWYKCYPAYLDSNHDGRGQESERWGWWVEKYHYYQSYHQYIYESSYHVNGPVACDQIVYVGILFT